MANVPSDRLCFNNKPFTKTGVDYLGPYQIKLSKGTKSNEAIAKRYIVLFTYLSTRAVHLEIAGYLSSSTFILSLSWFLAGKGTVRVMRSDNGTNFVGASTELKQSIKALDQAYINKCLVAKNMCWKFNPPVSPVMGGICESLLKSAKLCLKVIIRDKLFTEESWATFISEVESIINQRLIVHVSDDVNDFEALAPNYFIIESYCYNFSSWVFEKQEINLRRKWCLVHVAANLFWNRWKWEYMPSLNVCRKWAGRYPSLGPGVISTKDLPCSYRQMGCIIERLPRSWWGRMLSKIENEKGRTHTSFCIVFFVVVAGSWMMIRTSHMTRRS